MENPTFDDLPQMINEINERLKQIEIIFIDKLKNPELQDRMNFKEACVYIGETESAFRLHLAKKKIKRIKTGKHLVFLRKDLDEYLMQHYGT